MVQKLGISIMGFLLAMTLLSTSSLAAIDPLNLRCARQDREGDRIYLSEIHFAKAGTTTISNRRARPKRSIEDADDSIEGEVLSYALTNETKQFISGYSLYSISFNDNAISGLTGDPNTRTDGSFTLTRENQKNSGLWKFVYTGIGETPITAEFKCVYGEEPPAGVNPPPTAGYSDRPHHY